MSSRYPYNTGRRIYLLTLCHLILFAVVGVCVFIYMGTMIAVWYASFVAAMIVLMLLSIPRNIEVDECAMTINCVMDMTEIPLCNIRSIRKVSPRKLRWVIPIFGGCGFFGYYGHFFDFRHFHRVLIYASEWRYLVEIVDAYEEYYYVSCRNRDALIAELNAKIAADN